MRHPILQPLHRWKYPSLRRAVKGMWCPSVSGPGSTLTDFSGYGNHGTLINLEPEDWVIDEGKYCLDFDGSDEGVTLGDWENTKWGTDSFTELTGTISLWMKSTDTGIVDIMGVQNNTSSLALLTCLLNWDNVTGANDSGDLGFVLRTSTNNNLRGGITNGSSPHADGDWHNIVISWHKTQTRITIYIDGFSYPISYLNQDNGIVQPALDHPVGLGFRNASTPTLHYDGKVDDVIRWDREVSANEVLWLASHRGVAYEQIPIYLMQEGTRPRRGLFFRLSRRLT